MSTRSIVRYALAGLAVVILGALAGWYFFLHSQTAATVALNAGRGFGSQSTAVSPFGGTGASTPASGGAGTTPAGAAEPPQLWHVATTPVGGVGFATSTQGARLRYAERSTGYIFEAGLSNGEVERLTNSLMPKTYEAYFASGGRVLERSIDAAGAITTFAGIINTVATSSPLSGVSLPKGIGALAPDPKTPQLIYLQPQGSGVSGVESGWDGSKQKPVFSSALPDWRVWWLGDGRVVLAQKAADALAGYAYTLKNGSLEEFLGPLPGLTILPRTGSSALLYSTSSGGGLSLFVQVSATTTVARLSIATVADKCVWAPGVALVAYCAVPQTPPRTGFLDAWYRGETHSADAWWRIDAGAGQAQLIFTPTSDMALDVINPVMDDAGAYIAFMNNADESPWLLRLNK